MIPGAITRLAVTERHTVTEWQEAFKLSSFQFNFPLLFLLLF